MLNKLIDTFKENGYYVEVELKDVPFNYCCTTSSLLVLDFDEVTKRFCAHIKSENVLKSCDTLLFVEDKSEIHLVEIKKKSLNISCYQYVMEKLYEVPNKIVDSILVVFGIASSHL